MTKRRWVALWAVWAAVAGLGGGAWAQEQPPAEQPITAARVLQDLSSFLAQRQAYAVTVVWTVDLNLPQAQQKMVGKHQITVAAPNRIAVRHVEGQMPGNEMISDGQSLYLSVPQMNRHTKQAAPATLAELWDEDVEGAQERMMANAQLAVIHMLLMSPSHVEQMLEDSDGGKYLGVEQAAGQPCHHLQLKQGDGEQDIAIDVWVQSGPQPLLLKVAPDMSALVRQIAADLPADSPVAAQDLRIQISYELSDWQLDQPVEAEAFTFVPPADSQLAPSLLPQEQGQAESKAIGQPAPAAKFKTLDGQVYELAAEKARVVVLAFWATWCGPCRQALPGLQKLQDWVTANHKPVAIYAVNLREKPQQITQFWEQEKFTIPVLLDDGAAAEAFGVSGIPHTVVIADGKIIDVKVGYRPGHEEKLQEKIEQALGQ